MSTDRVPRDAASAGFSTRGAGNRDGVIKLAVLHQAAESPAVGGVKKAMKPGGYKDSSADIAYVLADRAEFLLETRPTVKVITPKLRPDPLVDEGWSFPDTESGIISAIREHQATHFWTNTALFSSHPLQVSDQLNDVANEIYIVGQPPSMVGHTDDKNWVNQMLKRDHRLSFPASWVVSLNDAMASGGLEQHLRILNLPYPIVGKPIRGRGSYGVKLCHNLDELSAHLTVILGENPQVMLEEFLAGQEGTVTVMPPTPTRPRHWAFPVVERFNHNAGIAPYNGVVAVTQNSRVVPLEQQNYSLSDAQDEASQSAKYKSCNNNAYSNIRRQCELVAQTLGATAPIRIDVRRRREHDNPDKNAFVMFDVNLKPNMTGPGRPGREAQASLSAMAAEALGWDYARLLLEILDTARPLAELRGYRLPAHWV